ncbi:MAG: hypothetical protein GY772_15315, partial [bacterium]|nr:hypothetical protein [bacterium]
SSVTVAQRRQPKRVAQSEPGGTGPGRSDGGASRRPGARDGGASLAAPSLTSEGGGQRAKRQEARSKARLQKRLVDRGEGYVSESQYQMRDLLAAILGEDPGQFTLDDAKRVVYLAGSHASGTVCATGTYTAEEHRALQIKEWKDERGQEKVTVTATWVQQVACTLDKEEFETVGVKDLAEKMARRVKMLQTETSESDVAQHITDMVVRETRARRRGHLEPRAEALKLSSRLGIW